MFSVGAARIENGARGVVAYQPAFLLGTSLNGVAMGTMVALGSAPAMTGALSWAVERRFPGLRWAVATLVATAGVVLLGGVFDVFFGKATSSVNLAGLLGSLGTTTVAYLLFSEGLQKLSAPTVSTLSRAESVTADVLGMVILGERLGPIGWWGISGIAAGIGILLLHPRHNARLQKLSRPNRCTHDPGGALHGTGTKGCGPDC